MRHLILAFFLLPACTTAAAHRPGAVEPGPEHALDWTLGTWHGVRRGEAEGSEDPMTMTVRSVLAGAGLVRELEIPHSGGVYRGMSVDVFQPERGMWSRRYANDVRRTFAELEGEPAPEGVVFRGTSPTRTRESRLVEERIGDGGWRRTMSVSIDGGASWSVLWTDELERAR